MKIKELSEQLDNLQRLQSKFTPASKGNWRSANGRFRYGGSPISFAQGLQSQILAQTRHKDYLKKSIQKNRNKTKKRSGQGVGGPHSKEGGGRGGTRKDCKCRFRVKRRPWARFGNTQITDIAQRYTVRKFAEAKYLTKYQGMIKAYRKEWEFCHRGCYGFCRPERYRSPPQKGSPENPTPKPEVQKSGGSTFFITSAALAETDVGKISAPE